MSEVLIALAERVEAATGADRELDFAIAAQVDERVIADLADLADLPNLIHVVRRHAPYLRYTASLDAAMTLVPREMRLMLSEWDDTKRLRPKGPWQAVLSRPGCDASFDAMRGFRCDHAATPALALTASALRAIAARTS